MMAGNWAQHAFIDAASPDNNYRNSITCINAYYNRVCFNDGYHIAHHLKPTQHWTEMPAELLANRAKYVENDGMMCAVCMMYAVCRMLYGTNTY